MPPTSLMVYHRHGQDLAPAVIDQLVSAVQDLPRPLMIQCTSANRAGIVLLLWMAKTRRAEHGEQNGHCGHAMMTRVEELWKKC